MESTLNAKVVFYLHTIQYRIGNLGVLGILLLLAAIVMQLSLNDPIQKQLLQSEAALSKVIHQGNATLKIPSQNKRLSAEAFVMQFPNDNAKEDYLKSIIKIAEKNKLLLESGQYTTLIKEAESVVFYEVSLPLKGTYPQIKQFVADSINALPNAALSTFNLQQISIEPNQIEAEVSFTLYFRKTI